MCGQQIQMSSFKGYKYMAVNAYTKYPEWANKLAQWFTNEDNQKLRFEMKNAGPANKAAAADDAVKRFLLLWLLWIRHSTESSKELEILLGCCDGVWRKMAAVILIIQIFRR